MSSPTVPASRPGVLDQPSLEDLAVLGVRPAITPEARPFWDAAGQGRLVVERCSDCGLHLFPPRGICRRCRSRSLAWVEVAPPAVLYAFTHNHHAWAPGLGVYTVVLVELPDHDGIRLVGVYDGDGREPRIGDRLDFVFTPFAEGLTRIGFQPWRGDEA
ncbi:MAG TPA: zinc ribbon domain-containing protein [Sporichthya sp.]|nr:zinc ribbon domain-containing protein [Sporichthya sp.]